MNNSVITSRTAAVLGLLLIVPGALFFSPLVLGIEPPLGPLAPLLATPRRAKCDWNVRGSDPDIGFTVGRTRS